MTLFTNSVDDQIIAAKKKSADELHHLVENPSLLRFIIFAWQSRRQKIMSNKSV